MTNAVQTQSTAHEESCEDIIYHSDIKDVYAVVIDISATIFNSGKMHKKHVRIAWPCRVCLQECLADVIA